MVGQILMHINIYVLNRQGTLWRRRQIFHFIRGQLKSRGQKFLQKLQMKDQATFRNILVNFKESKSNEIKVNSFKIRAINKLKKCQQQNNSKNELSIQF
ncbi:unnamed protein product [Paramecium octaurelia]|uniref:Uncharacterized protein n=1 Tax=Paramecium octaurelia TaxID=43137 RepID=A0A8S1YKE4_PAROT|nr:unnamed protein product [Paramecium octaurelia]